MDCPNCHTYNPEGRTVCWRCDRPLPKVEPKKKKQVSSQQWLYILIAVMLIFTLLNFCGFPRLTGNQPKTGSVGSPPAAALALPAGR